MQRKEKEGIVWLEFDQLANTKRVKQATFLRKGGISKGKYSSLNLAFHQGDQDEHVQHNLRKIQECLGLSSLLWAKQCHGTNIAIIPSQNREQEFQDCDGFITNQKKIATLIKHADCQAAIFYDPIHHAIANIHAGWRGNVKNIYSKTIQLMQKKYRSKPEELLVCISPSLGPKAAEFQNYQDYFPEPFWKFQEKPNFFNLWEIARMQLKESGILNHHIEIAEICTTSNQKEYFSYRKEKITGRHGTIVELID